MSDEYDLALGRATRRLADLEGMTYFTVVRLSSLPLGEAQRRFGKMTFGALIKEAKSFAKKIARDESRVGLTELLDRASRLCNQRNDILHSGHAYRATDLARVLVRKDGTHPEGLGVDAAITPEVFQKVASDAAALNRELFDWFLSQVPRTEGVPLAEGRRKG